MAVLDVDCRAQTAHVFCDIVAEDYRAHRGFAGTALAHEQHLLFLLAGVHIGISGESSRWGVAVSLVVETLRKHFVAAFNFRGYQV
jgi:hypothetical protein